jgi:hypothetical protein
MTLELLRYERNYQNLMTLQFSVVIDFQKRHKPKFKGQFS